MSQTTDDCLVALTLNDACNKTLAKELCNIPSNFPFHTLGGITGFEPVVRVIPMLSQWEWCACKFAPEAIMPSINIFFSLLQHLVRFPTDEVGRVVLECASHLPPRSLCFRTWRDLTMEGIYTAIQSVVFFLAISDIEMFHFDTAAEEHAAVVDIILLHGTGSLCAFISGHPSYGRALRSLRANLVNVCLTEDERRTLCDSIANGMTEVPIANVSSFISLFPLVGVGADLVYGACLRMCLLLMGTGTAPAEQPAIGDLASIVRRLKVTCDALRANMTSEVSTVIALVERVIVAGFKVGVVSEPVLKMITHELKFPIIRHSNADVDPMFIRELIHLTRSHLENIGLVMFGG